MNINRIVLFLIFFLPSVGFGEDKRLMLVPGFLTKVKCQGRLLVSAIGNEFLVKLEALPKELGCGVLLKPLALSGKTNLILETSSGSFQRIIEISNQKPTNKAQTLEIEIRSEL